MIVETLKAPYLLLAAPILVDPNFRKTVVLMGHHTESGALGWIVNRVVEGGAVSLLPSELGDGIHPDTPLRVGGPVATPGLLVLHRETVNGIESNELAPGLLISASPDILARLFAAPPSPSSPASGLLIFGYAGWGPEQLEREMQEGTWLVMPYDARFAFADDTDDLWERALAEIGVRPDNVSAASGGVS